MAMGQPTSSQQVERTAASEEEEVVEEILDKEGRPVKRIVRRPRKASELSEILDIIDRFVPKEPQPNTDEIVAKTAQAVVSALRQSGALIDGETLKAIVESREEKESLLDVFESKKSEEVKKLEEKIDSLEKLIIEMRHAKELEERDRQWEQKFEETRSYYERELSELRRELSERRYEGKPESVQQLEVKKDTLTTIGKDIKDLIESAGGTVIAPLMDVIRAQNLIILANYEQQGVLPPGTVRNLVQQKPITREDVERAKEKLARMKRK
ncbi:hypothetical protein DRP04_09545 [Archaeoglobales archaeon]|nr:MAG: hypothetical protein DRP04_09545 [Archaeoglobales archaeon]